MRRIKHITPGTARFSALNALLAAALAFLADARRVHHLQARPADRQRREPFVPGLGLAWPFVVEVAS